MHATKHTAEGIVEISGFSIHLPYAVCSCADFLFPECVAYASGRLEEGATSPRCTSEDSRQVGMSWNSIITWLQRLLLLHLWPAYHIMRCSNTAVVKKL